jgi:hypothetical protein
MKVLITELANEICVSVNEIMVFQQTMSPDLYTGVGKRTWFTIEGVNEVKKHFTGPHFDSHIMSGVVLGQCRNPRFVYAKIPNVEGKVVVKIPARLSGKLDKKRIGIEKLVHGAETSYQWVKIDQNASVC